MMNITVPKMLNYRRKMNILLMLFCMLYTSYAEVHHHRFNNHLHHEGPVGTCGQKTESLRSQFRNPSFPGNDTKEEFCIYTVYVNKDTCAIRLDLDVFELAEFKGGGCIIDSMTVLGAKGTPTTPFCGNMTNWSSIFEIDVASKVVLSAILSGSPPYRFSIKITQLLCKQIVPFISPNVDSMINIESVTYDYDPPTEPPATEAPTEAPNIIDEDVHDDDDYDEGDDDDDDDDDDSNTEEDNYEKENVEETTTASPDEPTPLPTIGLPTRKPQDVVLVVSSDFTEFQSDSKKDLSSKNWLTESDNYENPDGYELDPVGKIPEISLYKKFIEKNERERCLDEVVQKDEKKIENPRPLVYVVGGTYTNINEYPWQVALVHGKRFFCGGSLISSRHVLTAAHCIVGDTNITKLRISLGDHDLSTRNETNHTVRNVSRIYWNLQYNPVTIMHDITILEMDRPVEFSQTISPIRLPTDESDLFEDNPEVIITGWGRYDNKKAATSSVLKEYSAPLLNMDDCIAKWKNVSKIPISKERHTCLDISNGAPCHGDSGGPLITCSNSSCVQVGVVSFGHHECVDQGVPDVFTRVSHYTNWINMNLTPLYHLTYG